MAGHRVACGRRRRGRRIRHERQRRFARRSRAIALDRQSQYQHRPSVDYAGTPIMKPLFGFLLLGAVLAAQVSAPRVGFARFSGGSVHAVSGLPANLLVADVSVARAERVSFSDSGGLLARAGEIDLVDVNAQVIASFVSGEAAPVLNIDGALTTAIAWLPASHSILYWDGKGFVRVEANLAGDVTGVQVIEPGESAPARPSRRCDCLGSRRSAQDRRGARFTTCAGRLGSSYCAAFFHRRRRCEHPRYRIRERPTARAACHGRGSHDRAHVLRLAAYLLRQFRRALGASPN